MAVHRELLIDVGSASVGACFVEYLPKRKPLISNVKRVSIGTGSEETRSNIVALSTAAITTLLKEYQSAGMTRNVRVVLASPWYSARIRFVSSKAERPVKVSTSSISRTVHDFKAQTVASDGTPPSGSSMESVVTQVYVNGYPTSLTRTVMGTTLRVHLYESSADSAFLDSIRNAIAAVFSGARITFHSFPLLAFTVLRDIRDEENFTFIDAGGEITDVAIVHRDSLRYLGSFPKGSLSFVRAIEEGGNLADSASRISLYTRGELSPEESASFVPTFTKATAPWSADYEKIVETAQTETAIPQTTFIAADREELKWFGKIVESVKGIFPTRPVLMVPDFFQAHIELGDAASYDAFLSIEALFFESEKKELFKV